MAAEEQPESQNTHVPVTPLLVVHTIQSVCHMRMAVVAEDIVLPGAVQDRGARYILVPNVYVLADVAIARFLACTRVLRMQPEKACRASKAHFILGNVIRAGKVADYAISCTYAHVTYHRKQPCDERNRRPNYAEGVAMTSMVNCRQLIHVKCLVGLHLQ